MQDIIDSDDVPMVTLCVPAYNHQDFIGELLESIIKYSTNNIQLIIINDGSTDDTDIVIKSYAPLLDYLLSSFVYYTQDNHGISFTINRMINIASGKYIKIIASDDVLHKNSVTPFVNYLENNSADILFGDLIYIDKDSNPLGRGPGLINLGTLFNIEEFDISHSLRSSPTHGSAWMMRTDMIKIAGGFDETTQIEDWEFINRLTVSGIRFGYINEISSLYRIYENNNPRLGSYLNWFLEDYRIIKKYKRYSEPAYQQALCHILSRSLYHTAQDIALTDFKSLLEVYIDVILSDFDI